MEIAMKAGINFLNILTGTLLVTGVLVLTAPTIYAIPCDCCGCSDSTAKNAGDGCKEEKGMTIVDIAAGNDSFKTLVAAVKASGLVDTLKGPGPFTVFAPTDEAFAKIPKEDFRALLKPENRDKLSAILTYHVVAGTVKAERVVKLSEATTVNGQKVSIKTREGKVYVDKAQVVKTDILASNGVIHVIDTVLMPDFKKDIVDTAVNAGTFQTLVAAVKAAGLVETLKGDGPFTVFAPSDEAFAKLPPETLRELLKPENKDKLIAILTYHVLAGEVLSDRVAHSSSAKTVNGQNVGFAMRGDNVYVDKAMVVKADIPTSNGVIHVIDTVLMPK
jgi:uncharacterized surface protein with fasciclin (FAS1) repeats